MSRRVHPKVLMEPSRRRLVGGEAGVPEPLAVGGVVAATEVLLGAVIEAGNAVFGEQVGERRQHPRAEALDVRGVVAIDQPEEQSRPSPRRMSSTTVGFIP
jgi:hypothetical protein